MSRVLLCTSVGPGKGYSVPLLTSVLHALAGVDAVHVVDDSSGVSLGGIALRGVPIFAEHRLADPPPSISIHGRIARVREVARRYFLAGPWTHLYWHDCDMAPPADIVPRLLAHGVDVATGCYLIRRSSTPIIAVTTGLPDPGDTTPAAERTATLELTDGVTEVLGAGMGCMLVSRAAAAVPFRAPEWYAPAGPGEDIQWCVDWHAASGRKVLLDMGLTAWHVDADGTGIQPSFKPANSEAAT